MSGDPHGGAAATAAAKSSSSSSSSANAAMNVFHSYHALGDEIAKLQTERRLVEADTDSKRNEMGRLQVGMAHMETTGKKASAQRDEWNRKLSELQQQQNQQPQEVGPTDESTSREDGSATTATIDNSNKARPRTAGGLSHKVRLEQLGRLVRESRETFLQESANFRSECRSLRQQASSIGLSEACTNAFLGVHGVTIDPPNHHDKDGGSTGLGQGPPSAGADLDSDDDDEVDGLGDPSHWTDADLQGDDDETKELWQACVESQSRLDQWEQERKAAVAKLGEWTETSETRRERVVHLEEQLNRVTHENDDLDAQLKELQAMVRATPSPLEVPRIEAAVPSVVSQPQPPHKRARTDLVAQPNTGAAPPRRAANPYAKKSAPATSSTSSSRPAHGSTAATGADVSWAARRSNLQAAVLGPARSSTNPTASRHFRQHVDFGGAGNDPPGHRRRRRDKRFGCDLVVQDGTTLDASWDESPYTTPSPNHEGRGGGPVEASATASSTPSPNPAESSAELPLGTRGFPTARITPAAPATAASDTAHSIRSSRGFAVLADDDDDDDDVDDLLLRPALASGRK